MLLPIPYTINFLPSGNILHPCGGEKYSKKTLIEAEADSPEAYVKEYGRFPVLESTHNESGDVVIVTGDNQGSFVRYTFTE